jgi:hypothetical protein
MEIRTAGSNPANSFERSRSYRDIIDEMAIAGFSIPYYTSYWKDEEKTVIGKSLALKVLEVAPIIAELINDELRSSELWEPAPSWNNFGGRLFYPRGLAGAAMKTDEDGDVEFIGTLSMVVDPEIDLMDGDNLEALLTWIHEGGDFPLCKASFRMDG